MLQPLQGKQILIFVGQIYEDLELWYPKLRLIEAGATVVVACEHAPGPPRTQTPQNARRARRRRLRQTLAH